ncbi:hypothetical protein FQR65_LT20112 [Abscondita terminalis]|nr:hypothetical protein FQR65_LT20112 [Abscondita terminalis]
MAGGRAPRSKPRPTVCHHRWPTGDHQPTVRVEMFLASSQKPQAKMPNTGPRSYTNDRKFRSAVSRCQQFRAHPSPEYTGAIIFQPRQKLKHAWRVPAPRPRNNALSRPRMAQGAAPAWLGYSHTSNQLGVGGENTTALLRWHRRIKKAESAHFPGTRIMPTHSCTSASTRRPRLLLISTRSPWPCAKPTGSARTGRGDCPRAPETGHANLPDNMPRPHSKHPSLQ